MIFSDPRGGSTWISEVIGAIPRTASVWEPLTLKADSPFRALGFSWRQHIPESAVWPEAEAVFSRLLRGKLSNQYLFRYTSPSEIARAERLVFKFVRGKALLPWLTTRFEFDHSPILLVRHPFAVVASQLQHGAWDDSGSLRRIIGYRHDEVYRRHEGFLRGLSSREEYLTALWCMTNLIPLRHSENNIRWITVSYEALLLEPMVQLRRVFARWRMELPEDAGRLLDVPSRTTKEATFVKGVDEQLTKWSRQLGEGQVDRMSRVLEYFGVESYGKDPLPLEPLFHEAPVSTQGIHYQGRGAS